MQANPRTLDALFNSQLRYVVPMFQRLYVWQESPQWETLWEDVAEKAALKLAGVQSNPHYLGALIVEGVKPSTPREVMRFLVIDGQQRMTTLQLLLCSFRDVARKSDWKGLDKTLSRYLQNSDPEIMERPDEEVYKLWPTALNRDTFRALISAGSHAAISQKFPLVYEKWKRKPNPRSNLVEAYLYFSGRVEAWIEAAASESGKPAEDCAFALLQSLRQDFCVVEIALSDGDDSQEIFYSLNSQGRALSQSDLLRSLIFMRAEKEGADRDVIFDKYWNKFETEFWSQEVKRAGRTYSRLDLGLRYFLIAKTGQQIDARRVNEEYRRWISQSPPVYPSVQEELADFSEHSAIYERYESVDSSKLRCDDFRRVLADLDVSTALPLVMFLELECGLDPAQLSECLADLESFLGRRAFAGAENKEYNKLFVDVVASLRGKRGSDVAPALRRKLLGGGGSTRGWPTDDDIIAKAIGAPIYSQLKRPALRLVLELLEHALRTKKSEHSELSANLQIEHVMPQSWSQHWPLNGTTVPAIAAMYPHTATGELAPLAADILARNAAVQTLGNLTLLNMYLNPAASNGSFESKIGEYKNSVLRLNRHFDAVKEWDEKLIAARGRTLGELLCEIWPRPIVEPAIAASTAAAEA